MSSSNALTVPSRLRTDGSAAPGNATATGTTARPPPDILTYCHGSRMVYVTPGEDYDRAIEIAVESFPEIRDVDRDRICLEVRVVLSNQHEKKTAEIGRSAWSVVVPTLARFEIIEIRVAPAPKPVTASSSSEPPPYASEMGWYSDAKGSQTNSCSCRSNTPCSLSQPQSLTTRVVDLFTPKSSRCRHSPHHHHF